ncbi:MAG: hypothetical protein WCN27_02260 [Alphaproteobacteria bacterium]
MDFALTLQGIGGMNSFSAGVLSHLRKENIKPKMVSVCSGAIASLYHYLDEDENMLEQVYKKNNKNHVKHVISKEMQGMVHFAKAVSFGIPEKFRVISPWEKMKDLQISDLFNPFSLMKVTSPAQIFESEHKDEFFEDVAERFCKSDISIITNAYNYETGKAVIFLNPTAEKTLKDTRFKIGNEEGFSVKEICPDAIRGALQLIQFGLYKGMLDGAYQHNPFLSPLKIMHKIFLVTVVPISKPLKPLETTYDIEDFKTKMLFLNSIFSDISNIDLINLLIDTKIITHEKIHKIDLKILEPSVQKGFFDYFVEDVEMFNDGLQKAQSFINPLHL